MSTFPVVKLISLASDEAEGRARQKSSESSSSSTNAGSGPVGTGAETLSMAAKHIANKMTAVEGGSGMTEKEWVGGRSGCWKGRRCCASMLQRTTEFEGNERG